ncbi:MAG: UDP-4-amino-4,6-dideoxy-N-acetyl-beta-L-altrosamine transaminase [Candidatus Eremiobacteraeota bacterium]|nr:UDP-4-amino-4,6-dideoxy-N-acetyl-beta-L-altrosamine transaminase [Candidatus Eremiobacteraeota bacterium]
MRLIPYGHHSVDPSDIDVVLAVLRSDWLTQGPRIEEFERALCEFAGAHYAVAFSHGTAALHGACYAAGIGKEDEVITSPNTFVATANSVLYCGGKPVFADIEGETLNINPAEIEKRLTTHTKAIMPVHFAGNPCDMEKIDFIAKKNNLMVIEDAAHALGSIYRNSPIGACKYSNFAVFSFHPVKAIATGEGGAVLTNDREFYQRLLLFRNHGITKESDKFQYREDSDGPWYYEMQDLGHNFRLTDIQAALGLSQMKKLKSFILRRREIVEKYNSVFQELDFVRIPVEADDSFSAYHLFVLQIDFERLNKRRKDVMDELLKRSVGTQVHYIPVHLQPYYRNKYGYKRGDYPVSENYYSRALTIPLFPKMTDAEVDYVIQNVLQVLR